MINFIQNVFTKFFTNLQVLTKIGEKVWNNTSTIAQYYKNIINIIRGAISLNVKLSFITLVFKEKY